jgi:hypothetical protein
MSNIVKYEAATEEMDVFRLGEVMSKSGFFPSSGDAGKAVVKILAGREMGIAPVASMMGIHVIATQGGTSIQCGANLLASLVKRHPKYDYRIQKMDDTACVLEFFENGKPVGLSPFTVQDANKAGTKNMGKFPRNMLFARAMSNGVKWYCPDVTSGIAVYTPGEVPVEAILNKDELPPVEYEAPEMSKDDTPPPVGHGPQAEPEAPITIGEDNAQKFVDYAKKHGWPVQHLLNAARQHFGAHTLASLTREDAGKLKAHMHEKYPPKAARTDQAQATNDDTPPDDGYNQEDDAAAADEFSALEGTPTGTAVIGEEGYVILRDAAQHAGIKEDALIEFMRDLVGEKLKLSDKARKQFSVYEFPLSLKDSVNDHIDAQ